MITLDYDGKQLVLTGDELDRDIIKAINGVSAAGARRWALPVKLLTYLEARYAVERDGGILSDAAKSLGEALDSAERDLLALKQREWPEAALGEYTLRPHQEIKAHFLATIGSGFILDPPRLGKTLTMLRTLDLLDKWPILITVKPNTALGVARQVERAFPTKTVTVLTSGLTLQQRKKLLTNPGDIVILPDNLIEFHSKILPYGGTKQGKNGAPSERDKERAKGLFEPKELNTIGFRVIVEDEAHRHKGPKSHSTRGGWVLGDVAEHRYQMTGTPAPNQETEWWAGLRFLFPTVYRSNSTWTKRYINMVTNQWGIPKCRGWLPETRDIWMRIFELIHVRTENENEARQEIRAIPIELTKLQKKLYKEFAAHGMAEIGDELVVATDTMSLRHRLFNAVNGTPVLSDSGEVESLCGPSAKVDALLEYLDEEATKCIVVCESRVFADFVIKTLVEQKIETRFILGGMKAADSDKAEQDFQTNDKVRVIVINAAGAEGKELSAARRTLFLEISDRYDLNEQWLRRNLSEAQEHDTVEVAYVYAVGTLEQAKYEAYEKKDAALHEHLGDAQWIRRHIYGVDSAKR